ncbi:Eco57I restriction-modification methylase domain-containing protein [Geobacter sp.]|uniref:Eco57I restriction-modification methylase domain-containing protein n=1 Tax=Geobacter sp. TaxID=46610 RepID=UPI0027B97381|nr:N-6 DNA methylase [Geobacter sp.]
MRKRTEHGFVALRLEGGILPAEFFQKVAALTAKKQKNSDYRLAKGLNIRDEIGRGWRIAVAEWQEYQEHRIRTGADQNEIGIMRWLTSLLKQVLGFEDLNASDRIFHAERSFPINYRGESNIVPMVLATYDYQLDKGHVLFGEDGRKRSPHGLLQEYLNADESCLWGLVSNGLKIRLLRDNPSLSRPAFIEADLERIFEEELFADFAAMWLIFHASRFGSVDGVPEHCPLEDWREEAQVVGERALTDLRKGVTQALRELGNGFVQFPGNTELRTAIQDGSFTPMEMYQELLRLVYRFIFLFTAEDRDILNTPDGSDSAKVIYQDGYSITQLRELALKRHNYDTFPDRWEGLQVVFTGLSQGAEAIRLPALGGLFAEEQCPWIDSALIDNNRLLKAIYNLSFFRTGEVLARINYHDMDTEELGSVYESLLELHPQVNVTNLPWSFTFAGDDTGEGVSGSERKLSGSYYTPDCLVQELIKSALEPVISKTIAENSTDPAGALLKLKIIDPACGSGHFLLAASRRMAAELARLEADTNQPDEALYRHCMRLVVQKCIYGVDLNPMAVELCKTALWLETIEPGMPLGFLDNHIRCGNSLVGVRDPKIMEDGIPDAAFKALSGDDADIVKELKKQNKATGKAVQGDLFSGTAFALAVTPSAVIDDMPEDTITDITAKKEAYIKAQEDNTQRRMANIYTAAFFASKTRENRDSVPLTEDLNRLRQGLVPKDKSLQYARELSSTFRFFHWYLEFPKAFTKGGFDVVLGNPPWERIKLQEEEFFAPRSPEIAKASNKAARERLINMLVAPEATLSEKSLHKEFLDTRRGAEATSEFVRNAGLFPLTGVGDVNTYALFAELSLRIVAPVGRAGIIVPSGIATDDSTKAFFDEISGKERLVSLFDFENREALFKGVHRSYKFCLLTLGTDINISSFCCFAGNISHLSDSRRRFSLTGEDIRLLNPNTRTCPIFRSQTDAELTKKIYRRVPVLMDESKGDSGNQWGIRFTSLFHMSNDSHLFKSYQQVSEALKASEQSQSDEYWLPLYEAKMVHHFDHRWATFDENGKDSNDLTESEKSDISFEPLPRYWVPEIAVTDLLSNVHWSRKWLLGFRGIGRSTDERTIISSIIPISGVGNSFPLLVMNPKISPQCVCALVANLSAIVFDFVARFKAGGANLNFFIIKQLPVLPPSAYTDEALEFIVPRVLELTYTSNALRCWASDLGYEGEPFIWDTDRRAILRAELDAFYAKLYNLTLDELLYILDPADNNGEDYPSETFRVLKDKELRTYGEYRTKKLILKSWNECK